MHMYVAVQRLFYKKVPAPSQKPLPKPTFFIYNKIYKTKGVFRPLPNRKGVSALVKRFSLLLLGAWLGLCVAVPLKTALAAAGTVSLCPVGATVATLNAVNGYLVNGAASPTGALCVGGCTAFFNAASGTLEIQGLNLSGAGEDTPLGLYFGLCADGDLTLVLHGDNRITLPNVASPASGRGIYIPTNNALVITGSGSLTVTTGTADRSYAISAGQSLTVNSGVTLTASAGDAVSASAGLYAERLINHGTILAAGATAGIHCCAGITPATSENDGQITAYSTGGAGCGLMLSSKATFAFNGGLMELTGAPGHSAIGATSVSGGRLSISPDVSSGAMGASKDAAAVYSSQAIMAHYNLASRSYAYLKLPAASYAAPATGDTAALALWLGLMLTALGVAAAVMAWPGRLKRHGGSRPSR